MTPTFSSSALGNSVSERNTEIKYIIEEEKRKAKGRKCERKQEGKKTQKKYTQKSARKKYIFVAEKSLKLNDEHTMEGTRPKAIYFR